MKIFNIIFGILSIFVGGTCLAHPFASQIAYGYIAAIFIGVMGIMSIIAYFKTRKQAKTSASVAAFGTANLVIGIVSVIFMVLNMTVPFFTYSVQEFAAIVCIAFMIIEGASCIYSAITNKSGAGTGMRILTAIFGVIMLIGCIYGIACPAVVIAMFGVFLGATFMVQGFSRIVLAFAL